ncbi:MAG: hypothetical protein KGN76_17175 [Acidobacteriota bacterium]|nr:hypothetical protein [Acidobacteriota bacterium]
MLHFQTITNKLSDYMSERTLARSVDDFIHDLERIAEEHPDGTAVNNIRARVEAMVDLLEGRMEWANVDQARRLVTRVYDIRIAEELVLSKVRGSDEGLPPMTFEDPAVAVAGLLH